MIKKLLSYILSVIYFIVFGLLLGIFHPIQVIALNLFGRTAQEKSVELLNFLIYKCLIIVGVTVKVTRKGITPNNIPIIVVSNHKSLFDIPTLLWIFRRNHLKFISKKELGKGIPSVSYNLSKGGSALIDRNDKAQARDEIKRVAHLAVEHNYAVCIFPEGTRSKDASLKQFSAGGLETLITNMPGAVIVPVAIKNMDRIADKGVFPLNFGTRVEWVVLPAVDPKGYEVIALANYLREEIGKEMGVL